LLDTIQLKFHTTNLSERDLAKVFPGQSAIATLKVYPNEAIDAQVVRMAGRLANWLEMRLLSLLY
jgi:hypothetical protein